MQNLVYVEHDNQTLDNATLSTIAAAGALGGETDLLVVGHNCQSIAEAASQLPGVRKVLVADNEAYLHQLAEPVSLLVAELCADYDNLLAAATTQGKNFIPRVAALVDVQPISDVVAVISSDTFQRPIYAGNAIATVQSSDAKKILTIRTTAFDAVADSGGSASIEPVGAVHSSELSSFVKEELAESDRPELGSARVVISGGRGMQNGENFSLLEKVADKLGAAIGASRAAVDAGFVPNDMQVGQTGKIVAPELYIAVGISGAIQHLAGMKDSKVIVAINKDEEAPIFQVADYGLVADLFEVLPALEEKL